MRRLSPFVLALPIWLVFVLFAAVPASSQETPSATLTLLSQTSWNCATAVDLQQPPPPFGPTCPTGRELIIRFRARNTGTAPLGELAIGVTLYSRVLSRSAYEASLTTDPPVALKAFTLVREGTIQPGETSDFEVSMMLDDRVLDPEHSGVYPVKVDLRSGVTSVAAIRTPAIFLVREPEIPLTLSWTFVLSHPITFAPDGTFTDPSLETSLAPGGRLSGQIRALQDLAADPTAPAVDVAVSPVLLTQLDSMRGGYSVTSADGTTRDVPAGQGGSELAAGALGALRDVAAAPGVELTTLPFSGPEIPSLYSGGLGRDVGVQLLRGREVASALIQADPPEQILRPPGAALDDETIRGLAGMGIGTLIVGPSTVELPPQPLGFAGPATTALGDGAITAIVPEPSTDAVMTSVTEDPVRAAQVVLGELTTIWQEAPGETRSVALVLGEDAPLPGPFFPPLVRDIDGAPWLTPAKAAPFVDAFPPAETLGLANPSFREFPTTYVGALKQARRRVDTLRSMLPDTSIEPGRLEAMLLLAEARQFLTSTTDGLSFIAAVRDSVKETVDDLSLDTVATVSLSSDSGGIPVTVSNEGQRSLKVFVRLVAPQLRNAPSAQVDLGPGDSETLRLQAQLRSTGRFPVQVQMTAPDGRPIEHQTLIVRSTAYNRIALLITIGAAVMLLAVWARRFLPRRTT